MTTTRPAAGPLVRCAANPRYFADPSGRPVLLAGAHHWDNLVDNEARQPFDFPGYLDELEAQGHNFVRLWAQWAWVRRVHPTPYLRTGPGLGLDGAARFDLDRFDPDYFHRLRRRVVAAGRRGLYVSVMLFQGWSLLNCGEGNPWLRHPFNRHNNVNGVDGDLGDRGDGGDVHSLRNPRITRLQEAYVAKVLESVGDLGHVLFEISNESPEGSLPWQLHIMGWLRERQAEGRVRHPLGLTAPYGCRSNAPLFESPADWVSPGRPGGYRSSPPVADGRKIVLLDTDHLWGIGGDAAWVWKSFLRGHNPVFMDPLGPEPQWLEVRAALGRCRRLAARLDLAAMIPCSTLASSRYCLAGGDGDGAQMLVYLPRRRRVRVDLTRFPQLLQATWLCPRSGRELETGTVEGGGTRTLRSPRRCDTLLHLGVRALHSAFPGS